MKPDVPASRRGHHVAEPRPCRQRHDGVDPRAHASFAMRADEHLEVFPGTHVHHGGDTLFADEAHRGVEGLVFLRGRRGRYDTIDETGGVVLQHARGLTVIVAHDRPTRDVLGRRGNARGSQRKRVGETHVSVEPLDEHRRVGRDGIDPLLARKLATPVLMIPVPLEHPGSLREPGCMLFYAAHEFFLGLRVAELDGGETKAAIHEMHVRINEAGDEHRAVGVDDARRR